MKQYLIINMLIVLILSSCSFGLNKEEAKKILEKEYPKNEVLNNMMIKKVYFQSFKGYRINSSVMQNEAMSMLENQQLITRKPYNVSTGDGWKVIFTEKAKKYLNVLKQRKIVTMGNLSETIQHLDVNMGAWEFVKIDKIYEAGENKAEVEFVVEFQPSPFYQYAQKYYNRQLKVKNGYQQITKKVTLKKAKDGSWNM